MPVRCGDSSLACAPASVDELDRQPFASSGLSLDSVGCAEPEVGRQPTERLDAAQRPGELDRIIGPQWMAEEQSFSPFEQLLVERDEMVLIVQVTAERLPEQISLPLCELRFAQLSVQGRSDFNCRDPDDQ
jgi:hypothetical protein